MRALLLVLGATGALAASERSPIGPVGELQKASPPPGYYDAQMCVTVGAAAASCGPATADVGGAEQVLVRVSDIRYRLQVIGDQLGVSLFHGPMQIDGFFAPYQWSGGTLQFIDTEKGARYEIRLGARRFDAP